MISRIEDLPEDKKFKIAKVSAQSDKDFGKPDFIKDLKTYSDYKKDTFEELNLADAFSWWLLNKKPELKELEGVHNTYIEGGVTAKPPPSEPLYMMTGQNAEQNNAMSKVKAISTKIEGFTRSFNTLKNQYQLLLNSRHNKDRIDRITKSLIQFQKLHDDINQYYDSVKNNNVKNNTVNRSIVPLLKDVYRCVKF
jgi:hypothetical protein